MGWTGERERLTYSLCVDLVDIRQSLGQNVTGHLISELVSELSCLSAGSIHGGTSICYGASHDTTDGGRDLEDM